MRFCCVILGFVLSSSAVFSEDVLLILDSEEDVVGELALHKNGQIIVRCEGKVQSYKDDDVDRIVKKADFASELAYRKKQLKKEDAASYLRLALLAVEMKQKKFAVALLNETVAYLSDKKKTAPETGKNPASTAKGRQAVTEVPWPPEKYSTVKLDVKTRVKGKITAFPRTWMDISSKLSETGSPFSVVSMDSTSKADYIFRVGFDLRIDKVNKVFDSVAISNEWTCTIRLTVRSAKTGKLLFSKELPELRKTCSAKLKGGDQKTLGEALGKLFSYLERTPAFRLKKTSARTK